MKIILSIISLLFIVHLQSTAAEASGSFAVVSFFNKPDYLSRGMGNFFFKNEGELEIFFKVIPLNQSIAKYNISVETDSYTAYHKSLQTEGITLSSTNNIISFFKEDGTPYKIKYDVSTSFKQKNIQNSSNVDEIISTKNMYKIIVNLKTIKKGKYYFQFSKTIDDKTVYCIPGEYGEMENHFEIKSAQTKKEKGFIVLDRIWWYEQESGLLSLSQILEKSFKEKDISENVKFELAKYFYKIAEEKKDKTTALAWWLLLARFKKVGMGPRILGSWEKVLKNEHKIEKITKELKEKYFPDMKYKYPPKQLSLSTIYADNEKLKKMAKNRDKMEPKVNDEDFAEEGNYVKPEIKADIIISVKANGSITSGKQKLKVKDIQVFLKKVKTDNKNKILVIGQESCNLSLIESVLGEIEKSGMENIVFMLENELSKTQPGLVK